MTNRSQAVRLPKEFQFSTDEVFIRKEGEEAILSPRPTDWGPNLELALRRQHGTAGDLGDQRLDSCLGPCRKLERIHVLDRDGTALEYLQRSGTRILLAFEYLDDPAQRRAAFAGKRPVLLALQHLPRWLGRNILEVQVGQLAVAQQLEVLELAEACPEMKRVQHHPYIRVIRFAHDSQG